MSEQREILLKTLHEESANLHAIIRSYVLNMGLASGTELDGVTGEILNETVVAALQAADTYDTSRRPVPWLLGIAVRRIQRAIAAEKKSRQREIPFLELSPEHEADANDEEVFERFADWLAEPQAF